MISTSYVKDNTQTPILFDVYTNLLLEFDKIEDNIRESKYAYEAAYADYMITREFLESGDDDKNDEVKSKNLDVNEKKRNFVEKIGSSIKALFEKAYDFICNILDKIKGDKFKLENDLSKLSELKKKHPDLSEKIQISFEEGKLNVADAKTLADLEKEYLAIMKLNDSNEMNERWIKAKAKFNEGADIIINTGAIAAAGLSIVKLTNTVSQCKHNMHNEYVKAYKSSDIKTSDGVHLTRLKLSRAYVGLHADTANKAQRLIMSIQDGVAKALDKFDIKNTDRDRFHRRMIDEYNKFRNNSSNNSNP